MERRNSHHTHITLKLCVFPARWSRESSFALGIINAKCVYKLVCGLCAVSISETQWDSQSPPLSPTTIATHINTAHIWSVARGTWVSHTTHIFNMRSTHNNPFVRTHHMKYANHKQTYKHTRVDRQGKIKPLRRLHIYQTYHVVRCCMCVWEIILCVHTCVCVLEHTESRERENKN